jgi:hypothetical protein
MQSIKRVLLTASLLLFVVASTARAQAAVDGKWVGTINGPQGPGEVVLDLKAEGETLTGTIGFFGMEPAPFTAGKVSGSDVSFTVTFGDGSFTLPFQGKHENGALTLTVEGPNGPDTIAFRRPDE